jgi:hypothetical protein
MSTTSYDTMEHLDKINLMIQKYGNTDPQYVWSCVSTMEELFYCNKEFIKNNLTESFYHYGSLAIDSRPLANNLSELHDKGVFTYDGQGSLMIYDKWTNKKWTGADGTKCGGWFYSIEQKPYLDCIIEKKHTNDLLKYLEKINKDLLDDKIKYIIHGIDIKLTNIQEEKYNVTRSKTYKKLSQKNTTDWKYGTNLWQNSSFSDAIYIFDDIYDELYNIISNNYVVLNLTTENYGSNVILEKILLDFFNKD